MAPTIESKSRKTGSAKNMDIKRTTKGTGSKAIKDRISGFHSPAALESKQTVKPSRTKRTASKNRSAKKARTSNVAKKETPQTKPKVEEEDSDFFERYASTPRALTPPPPWTIPEHPFKLRATSGSWGPIIVLGTMRNGAYMWHPERKCAAHECIHPEGRGMKHGDRVTKCCFVTCSTWRHYDCYIAGTANDQKDLCQSDEHLYTWGGNVEEYRKRYISNYDDGSGEKKEDYLDVDLKKLYAFAEGVEYVDTSSGHNHGRTEPASK
ncbi:hypothetical protein BJ508DRAFT_313112 [Ascobolus immersus RN42]|uniref:Uncharacterized protein n=1 Tax=Ascobolus immersus RN42 TaxID=1160509 RepID=A0A3N4HK04_ASCIM|nr:hypothetical protein BJ508DRAFT_313112 [Ascobolus immersus RN42]